MSRPASSASGGVRRSASGTGSTSGSTGSGSASRTGSRTGSGSARRRRGTPASREGTPGGTAGRPGSRALAGLAAANGGGPGGALGGDGSGFLLERGRSVSDMAADEGPGELLADVCVAAIVKHFGEHPVRFVDVGLKKKQVEQIVARLSLDLPRKVAREFLSAPETEPYWRARALALKFPERPPPDLRLHGSSWKRTYFEEVVEHELEHLTRSLWQIGSVQDLLELASDFVRRLHVPYFLSGLDIAGVLAHFPHLEDLRLTFAVRNVGTEYDEALFRAKPADLESLAEALKRAPHLHTLAIPNSRLEDLRPLALENCPSLTALDFAHNLIGDDAVAHLCERLEADGCALASLGLRNNRIGPEGARRIARALVRNRSLIALDLSMNSVRDGAAALFAALRGEPEGSGGSSGGGDGDDEDRGGGTPEEEGGGGAGAEGGGGVGRAHADADWADHVPATAGEEAGPAAATPPLQTLRLRSANVPDSAAEGICALLQASTALLNLDIASNGALTADSLAAIAEAWMRNPGHDSKNGVRRKLDLRGGGGAFTLRSAVDPKKLQIFHDRGTDDGSAAGAGTEDTGGASGAVDAEGTGAPADPTAAPSRAG